MRSLTLFLPLLVASAFSGGSIHAADFDWVGDVSADFLIGANWESDPSMPNPATDIHRFKSTAGPVTITNVSIALAGTGATPGNNQGQILFESTAPAYILQGGTISLPAGTFNNAIVLSSGSTATQTIASNLVIGNGATASSSIVNHSTSGGLLKLTGNITGGTGAGTPGAISFNVGNAATQNGNYQLAGNITKGGASSISLSKNGSGTLTLGGTNDLTSLGQNQAGSMIVINGGKTSILQGGVNSNWGGSTVGTLVKITGGELYATYATGLRSKLEIDGGKLTIGSSLTESEFSFGNHASTTGEVFTLKSGIVDFACNKTGGYTKGFVLATGQPGSSISGSQTGGNFLVNGRSAAGQVFTLGNNSVLNTTTSYPLSGGLLDLKGQTGVLGFLQINADAGGTSTTTFTLSGTGKLISRFSPASAGGITGGTAGAKQVLALNGGTLVAGRIDAANLRGSVGDTNGTIVNNGSKLSPGDDGFTGKTTVSGNLTITTGSLAIDIGGTSVSTAWQDSAGSGKFDQLAVTGSVTLGGELVVKMAGGFIPERDHSFAIITGASVTGGFSNVEWGTRMLTADGLASFIPSLENNAVILRYFDWLGAAPHITRHPASLTALTGKSVTFDIELNGKPPLSYQWHKDGTAISGATLPWLTLGSVSGTDAGSYHVVVSNTAGSATSTAATLVVNASSSALERILYPMNQAPVTDAGAITDATGLTGGTMVGAPLPSRIAGATPGTGYAWDFSSSASYVQVPAGSFLNKLGDIGQTTGITVSGWLKLDYQTDGSTPDSNAFSMGAVLKANNTAAKLNFTFGSAPALSTSLTQLDGNWHHYAATFDFQKQSNNLVLYVNGVAVSTRTYPVTASFAVPGTSLGIGASNTGSSPWPGQIDEFSIHSRALVASEVTALYNSNTITNAAPLVVVGADSRTIQWSAQNSTILRAVVTPAVSGTWSKTNGPTATITNTGNAITNVTFSGPGTYIFRHTATNSGVSNFGEVVINVIENQPPVITQSLVSPEQLGVATMNRTVQLKARATDDGLPNPQGLLTSTWTQLSGPDTVTVTYPELWETPATIPAVAGTYVMQFSVTDGAATTNSTVSIVVVDSLPPAVTAHADAHTLNWSGTSATTTLRGSITDDGRPLAPGTLTGTWTQVSGPSAASFATPVTTAANTGTLTADTQVALPAIGQYVFRFTGSDGGASTETNTWVTVWAPGAIKVNAGSSRVAWLPDASLALEGSHSANPAATVEWSSIHGPAPVVFSSPAAINTQATFSAAGKYRIQLKVTDGAYIGQDTFIAEVYDAAESFGYTPAEQQNFKQDLNLDYIHEHAQWSRLAPPPPPYVHPRILFNPDDLPDLRQRLSSTTTSGQLAMANIRTSAAKVTGPTTAWRPAYDALTAGDASVFNALSSTDRSSMAGSIKNECFRALIDDDAVASAKAGAALAGLADSIYQTLPSVLTPPSTDWRAFLQVPCYGDTLGWGYDFTYNHMTLAQRTSVRRTLALMTNEVWNVGLDGLPGLNSNISNWIPLTGQTLVFNTLAIEGEEGSDPDLALRYMALYDRMGDSMAFPDGATFEGMGKGWIGLETYFALAKRGHKGVFSEMARNHLRKFYLHCMEPYGYGFNWDEVNGGSNSGSNSALGFRDVQVAKFLFPGDPLVDFVYRNACGTNYNAKFTGGGLLEAICAENTANPSQTWSQALAAQVAPSTPLTQFFNKRGLFTTRSEWSADALKLQFQPRSVPGGHSNPDRNSFSLSGLGRTWVRWYTYASGSGYLPGDATVATSVVRVDNKGSSTVPATVVDFHDSASFSYTVGDARDPYGKAFGGNIAPTDFSLNDKILIKSPLDWADLKWADLPDWYSSEKVSSHGTRSIRNTRAVQRAFRTAALVRGGMKPYSIIVDDIQMDQAVHNYKWRITLDSDLTEVTVNGNDAIVTSPGSSTSMLVRLLSSSAPATFRTDDTDPWIAAPWLDIEVNAVAPDFKVLLLPFENGTPLPVTTWRGNVLDVAWPGGQTDHLLFAPNADGRTRLSFSRGAADTVAPVLTLPADITTTATGADGAVVTFNATATDDVDGPLPVTCSPPSGTTFPIGTTTVQCSANDASLNGAGGTFTVTVLPGGFSLAAPVVSAQSGNQSAVLLWDAIPSADSYIVQRSTSGSGFTTVASGFNATRFEDTGLTNGTTYYYTVTAVNGAGQGPASNPISLTPAALPGGWSASDIGTVGAAGTSVLGADGTATLTSSGSGFGSTSDSFHFAAREWNGDGSIVVRMLGLQNATNYSRGGIIFRQSTAANAAFGFIGSVYYASDYSFSSRASTGAGLVNSAGTHSSMPQWFKLTRSGSTLSAYQSLDTSPGMQTWKLVGSAVVPLNSPMLAGLALLSNNTASTVTASFDHFGIYTVPTITPQADIVRAATRPDGAHVDFDITGQSNVDGLLLANCTPASGSLFPVGTTTVTATVTDSAGQSATTSFTVTVTAPPEITEQPVSLTVNQGESAQFTVTATTPGGVSNLYQWRRNGADISGANQPAYSIASAQSTDAGSYDVVVSNIAGSVVSSSATLAVTVPPTITQQPVSRTVTAGSSVSFTVTATVSGEVPNVYQWRKGGLNISGAIQATYAIASAQPADAGAYDVVVSNTAGSVTSSTASLTINPVQGGPPQWVGDTDAQFANGANWTTDPNLPSLSADTWQVNGPGSVNTNLTLNVGSPLIFTGTGGRIAFGAASGTMGLSGSDITLFQGTNDAILTAVDGANTTTIGSNLILGNGSANTISLSSTGTGLLKVTGNITGGTGAATAGVSILSFGSTDAQDGNYEVTGNITKGSAATSLQVTKRGTGTLALSGVNTFNQLNFNAEAASTAVVRINGGTTNVANIVSGSGRGTQTLRVSVGTLNVTGGARGIKTKLTVDGGIMNISGERLSFNGGAAQPLAISAGHLNSNTHAVFLGNNVGNSPNQTGNVNFTGTQSGGAFRVLNNFNMGGSAGSAAVAFDLSGGTLDVNGGPVLGADTGGTGSTTLTVSGTGKLISRVNPGGTSGGISGSQAGAVQVLALNGGTLVAGRIVAANLRGSAGGSNGTIVNNGTAIAPGDIGSSGKTTVSGNLTINSGSLAIDIGGTSSSTAWQDAAGSSKHDQLTVTGTAVLSGTLNVSRISSFVPNSANTFGILTGSAGVSGTFTNVAGGRVATTDGTGSFAVTYTATQVILSDYQSTQPQGMPLPGQNFSGTSTDSAAELLIYALGAGASPEEPLQPVLQRTGDHLAITFTRLRADVSYIVEASSDLAKWDVIDENPGNIGEEVTVADTVDLSAANPPHRFMRVRVVKP